MAQIQEKTEAFAASYPFDFIIGSSHLVHGQDTSCIDFNAFTVIN